ncbi:MAG: C40 family peptidase, partial [Nocardioides sp.]|nr:C40 family peptidase [Nocardioides sp.]
MPGVSRMLTSAVLMLGLVLTGLAVGTPAQAATSAASAAAPSAAPAAKRMTPKKRRALKRRNTRKIRKAVRVAKNQIGDPYSYGGNGPGSFDCSGLIDFSFGRAGFPGMPRTSSAQARHARKIKRRNLHRGDLMFFHGRGGVYHVAIFLYRKNGNVVMLHAPNSGQRVKKDHPWTNS